ncbi:MAG: protein kinase, partial [Byssovorax sp.]
MALAPGSLIAERFLIETVAGSGGMSTVYRAIDRVSGLPVALKLLHAVDTGHNVGRFEREAELLVELHHPGIVAFVARGVAHDFTGDQPFLAMEWLDGEDLCQRLTRGLLSWPE